jgi:AcrR family transcriptional regulator
LSDDRIVSATLRLAAGRRPDDVSMRALALELNVPVTTLYNYVPNKDALITLITDYVLRPVQIPAREQGTWEERLKQLERDARAAMAKYPGLSLDRRGVESAEGARLAEGVLSILTDAGLDSTDAALAFATLFTFMLGQIDLDLDVGEAGGAAAMVFGSVGAATNLSRDELFEFGFDAVIAGLRAKLDVRPPRATRRRGT